MWPIPTGERTFLRVWRTSKTECAPDAACNGRVIGGIVIEMLTRRRNAGKPHSMSFFDPTYLTALTFDCYGTLIDWETGLIEALRPLLARHRIALTDDQIITACQDIDIALCDPP